MGERLGAINMTLVQRFARSGNHSVFVFRSRCDEIVEFHLVIIDENDPASFSVPPMCGTAMHVKDAQGAASHFSNALR